MKVVVAVQVLSIRNFQLPATGAIVLTFDDGGTVTHQTHKRRYRSDEITPQGTLEFPDEGRGPYRFSMPVSSQGPTPIRLSVGLITATKELVLGTGAIPYHYQLHTGQFLTVPCVNERLQPVGAAELRLSVEKEDTQPVVMRRPSMPLASDHSMWPGVLRMQVRSVQGLPPFVPDTLKSNTASVTVQFGSHNKCTSQAPWVLKSQSYSATWSDSLQFDIVPQQSRQILFTLYSQSSLGSQNAVVATGSMHLVLPANKTTHMATQTVALSQDITLTVIHEQTYVQPVFEGAGGRPKSAYHRDPRGENPSGVAKPRGHFFTSESEDDAEEGTAAAAVVPQPARPMSAKVSHQAKGQRPLGQPPRATPSPPPASTTQEPSHYPQKIRNTVDDAPDDLELIDADELPTTQNSANGLHNKVHTNNHRDPPADLQRTVDEQREHIQHLMMAIDQLQETVLRQQQLIESLQRNPSQHAPGDSRPSSAMSVSGHRRPISAGCHSSQRESIPLQGFSDTHLRAKFAEYDASGTGYITRDQLKQFYLSFDNFGLIEDERSVNKFLSKYARGSGRLVSFDDFAQLTLHLAQR